MYDSLSQHYDRFVNWQNRLAYEMPFIEQNLNSLPRPNERTLRIADTACASGMHGIALARKGYEVVGTDLSPQMIAVAKQNAAKEGLAVNFEVAAFGEHTTRFGEQSFDAVLCLGNSLPHVLTETELQNALLDFYQILRSPGVLIIQNQNFDRIVQSQQRQMEPQSFREGDEEWLFLRFYDFLENGLIRFNFLTLSRQGKHPWRQEWQTSLLRPIFAGDLVQQLQKVGFSAGKVFGTLGGDSFDPLHSPNLVVVTQKT